MLQTMARSFISRMWSTVITSMLPVAVTKMSARVAASSMVTTSKPSMAACRAQMGSASETMTRQPPFLRLSAEPLPTSPKPQTMATLPASMTSVARRMASTRLSRQPYLLSNFDLVTESLTLMAGNRSEPSSAMCWRRCTPVVVSSVTPMIAAPFFEYQPGCSVTRFLIAA